MEDQSKEREMNSKNTKLKDDKINDITTSVKYSERK